MHLTNLSWYPTRPCMLLKWPNVTIMLDCAVDMSSLVHFLPHTYFQSKATNKFDTFSTELQIPYLKKIRENVYVDGLPEVHPTPLEAINMELVDCIIVSNWSSLLALPFYAHNTGFTGSIYATEPVIQFGKLIITEIIEYFERIVTDQVDNRWKDPAVFSKMPNLPVRSPYEWKHFYSIEVLEKTLEMIKMVSFKQTVEIEGNVSVSSYCSGFHMGSCNWVIKTQTDKIVYLSTSSCRTTHTKIMDNKSIHEADILIITSLSQIVDNVPLNNITATRDVVIETLKKGGNVLFPVQPVGGIFELMDMVSSCIDNTTGIQLDTPIYFISPVAKQAIAYSNVNAEWLSNDRQNLVYVPQEPFAHAELVRSGRIKIYESLYDNFSQEYKTPCVIFCGHPSLRIGDAAHLLELWGNDPKNAIVCTSPEYPLHEVYGPFEGLPIRAYGYPIDTRIDFGQLNNTLMPELKPKSVYLPDAYAVPMLAGRQDLMIQFTPFTPLKYLETVFITTKKANKRKIRLHPEVIKKLNSHAHTSNDFGMCRMSGLLSVYDDNYELMPAKKSQSGIATTLVGSLTADALLQALEKKKLSGKIVPRTDDFVEVSIESLSASIKVSPDGSKSIIKASSNNRPMLVDIISSTLSSIC